MHSVEIKDAIRTWQDYTGSMSTGHPDEASLYQMALPGGLADAPRADINHLAGCPACLEKWELLTRVMADSRGNGLKPGKGGSSEYETDGATTPVNGSERKMDKVQTLYDESDALPEPDPSFLAGYGFLKAAATDFSEPVFLNSHCRRFVLGIFTDPEAPDQGMITLDVTDADSAGKGTKTMEDRLALVKDASGRTILNARIHHGRAAARIHDINQYDFSTWTITLSPSKAGT